MSNSHRDSSDKFSGFKLHESRQFNAIIRSERVKVIKSVGNSQRHNQIEKDKADESYDSSSSQRSS